MSSETKEKKRISVAKLLLIALGFILLMSVSELLYNFKNKDSFRMGSYPYLTRLFAKTRNLELSLKYLDEAAEIRFVETINRYSEIEFGDLPAYSLQDPQNVQGQYLNLLSQTDHKLLSSTDPKHIGKLFYQLGLIAYMNNKADELIPLWQTAVYLAPEWSYFHVELANYFLSVGDKEKAESQIEFCQKFTFPKKHCIEFEKKQLELNKPEPVGFLESVIMGL